MKILKISSQNEKEALKAALFYLEKGKTIVFPTDTVYGLLADVANKEAVDKIFKIKKRTTKKPVPIFIKDIEMAKKFTKIDKEQEEFLKLVWPGRVTIVLKRKKRKLYGVAPDTIALRIPDYEAVNFLLEKLNLPLVGTSANISGKLASGNIKEILNQFKGKKYQPDLVIDAGNLPKRKPSTVLDLTVWPPSILRA